MQYDYQAIAGGETVEAAGMTAADQWTGNPAVFAEIRANIGFTYSTDDYSVNLTGRYQSEGEDITAKPETHDKIADAVFYTDIQGTYYVNDTYTISAGVRNLFDVEAPYMSNYDDMNTINYSYDLAGQYLYLKATAKF